MEVIPFSNMERWEDTDLKLNIKGKGVKKELSGKHPN